MNEYIYIALLILNIGATILIYITLARERKKNRVIQAFIAGVVRSISDYVSRTDAIDLDEMPERTNALPIPYKIVLANIEYELLKNVYKHTPQEYLKWFTKHRNLFQGETIRGDTRDDGFVSMNYNLFDSLVTRWCSPQLMTANERAYLSEEISVTEENVGELQGEIAMYKDLLAGKLKMNELVGDRLDDRLAIMFSHIKPEYLGKLKNRLLPPTS